MSDGTPAIEMSGLSKAFDSFVAVDGVDLAIEQGELFSVLGPTAPVIRPLSRCCVACRGQPAALLG
jgi:ABC-type polar amino acid transport system ATPase subunit